MNARKFFKNCLTLSVEEVREFTKTEYHRVQDVVFSTMPEGCFLKMRNGLGLRMFFMLSPKMIEKKVVSQKDICSLCSIEDCPFNDVNYKNLRIIKVKLLGNLYNR